MWSSRGHKKSVSNVLCYRIFCIWQSILLCSPAEKAVSHLSLRVVLPARWEPGWSQGGLPISTCVLFLSFTILYHHEDDVWKWERKKTKPEQSPAWTPIFSLSCWLSSNMQLKRRCPGSRNRERLNSGVHPSLSRYVVLGSKCSESGPVLGNDFQTNTIFFICVEKETLTLAPLTPHNTHGLGWVSFCLHTPIWNVIGNTSNCLR